MPAQRLGQLVDEFPGWYDPLRELGVMTDRILIPDTLTARLSTVASDFASSAFDASIRGRGPPESIRSTQLVAFGWGAHWSRRGLKRVIHGRK